MKIIKGDLLQLAEEGEFDIIVHGCNCFNTMGSGIARQIRQRHVNAWSIDRATIEGDVNKLGNYTESWAVGYNGPYRIINAYTQYHFNRGAECADVFEYGAFELILKKLAIKHPSARYGFPMIGMGLAGGDKDRIPALIAQFSDQVAASGGEVTLVEFAL